MAIPEKIDFKEIGKRIKLHREQAGLSQTKLGAAINRTESSIRKYENGDIEAPLSTLEKIADELNISVFNLLSAVPEQKMIDEIFSDKRPKYKKDRTEEAVTWFEHELNDFQIDLVFHYMLFLKQQEEQNKKTKK